MATDPYISDPYISVTQTARAYTGHEQIAELSGLIHMNARVYDSDIGRFLSADTIIQAPHDSQSYNRYSYVRNNPLMFTDPSGHSWFSKLWKKIKKHLRTIISIVIAVVIIVYAPELLFVKGGAYMTAAGSLTLAGSATIGALAGFASTLVATGSITAALKGAMWGAISAGATWGIGHGSAFTNLYDKVGNAAKFVKAIMHGLSRTAIAKLQTGSGKGGFLSGFASSVLGGFVSENFSNAHTVVKVTMAAIAGGTASVLGGGKFSNGAMAGAFIMMFNDLSMRESFSKLGKKISDGTIGDDITQGVKGGYKGYQEVRDNAPAEGRYLLAVVKTQAEIMGGAAAVYAEVEPILIGSYDFFSGFFFDTIPVNVQGVAGYWWKQITDIPGS